MEKEKQLSEAILKVALGFQVSETVEEYAEVDGALKLTKRKRTKKDVPPDLKAVQLLMETNGTAVADMSDEELETEKKRLLAILAEEKKTAKKVVKKPKEVEQVCDEPPTKPRKPRAKSRRKKV